MLKRLLAIFGIVGILLAATVAGIAVWSRGQSNRIYAAYKERQLPTSLQELNQWYAAVPDAENSALGFLSAVNAIVAASTEAERVLPIVGAHDTDESRGPLKPDELQTAKEYLAKNEKALELARAAAALKSSRYPIDLTSGPGGIDINPLERVRHVARLFWLEGLVRAQENNTTGAVESYSVAYAVGRSLSAEPLLIAQMVAVAIEGQTARDICIALSSTPFSASDLDKLAALVSQSPGIEHYGRAIAGEGVFAFFDPADTNPFSKPTLIFDRSAHAANVLSLYDASLADLPDAIARIEALEHTPWGGGPFSTLSVTLLPGFVRAFDSVARASIYRDLLLVTFAIEKYRLETNVLPENLAALAPKYLPAIPHDPYGDREYLYQREEKGYAVYSLGPDRSDGNGGNVREGKPPRPGTKGDSGPYPGDITLRVAR